MPLAGKFNLASCNKNDLDIIHNKHLYYDYAVIQETLKQKRKEKKQNITVQPKQWDTVEYSLIFYWWFDDLTIWWFTFMVQPPPPDKTVV